MDMYGHLLPGAAILVGANQQKHNSIDFKISESIQF